jgi:hypothetical protein
MRADPARRESPPDVPGIWTFREEIPGSGNRPRHPNVVWVTDEIGRDVMTSTAHRGGQGVTGVRVALFVLFIGLGQASFEWLRSLGMDAVTSLVVWAIPVLTGAAVALVLWLASDRAFALRNWLPVAVSIPVYLGGAFGLATATASLVASVVTGVGFGVAAVAVAGVLRARRAGREPVRR